MTYRTFNVSYQKDEGFQLRLVERSRFRDAIESVADKLCAVSRHGACKLFEWASTWAWKVEKEIYSIPIERSTADTLSWPSPTGESPWAFLDDEPEESVKKPLDPSTREIRIEKIKANTKRIEKELKRYNSPS